ncbi:response regulator transcription factor [uncultured Helcococcus sp.]|uniref:response regulator transcription factor n=1 Tax=uncultured Helcococcus sp. TaxID=1072508 RepID=UPI00261252C4|nr:response regulator transcription factor [uncultured Helcococcus sp.]
MRNIVVVEDDQNIRDLLVYALNNNGYRGFGYPGYESFFANIKEVNPSLILLDLMLDGKDGYQILKELRESEDYKDIPVIIITAKDNEFDKVKGLDMGADDYITKPFGVLETISRIKALLRRVPQNDASVSVIDYEDVLIDYKKRKVFVEGEEVILTYKEFEMLYYLMENKNIVISRNKLMEQVWGFDYAGETRTIDVHVRTLRQKLGKKGELIKTVRNVGYKLGE